jgi:putative transferase (TIGR04331 family)
MEKRIYNLDILDDFYNAHTYIDKLSEEYVRSLSASLNMMHNKKEDVEYWNLIIGFWVKRYLSVLYCHYSFVKLSKNTNFESLASDQGIPIDGECYSNLCVTREYVENLRHSISLILKKSNLSHCKKSLVYCKQPLMLNIKNSIRNIAFDMLNIIFYKRNKSIIFIKNTYFDITDLFRISRLLGSRIIFSNFKNTSTWYSEFSINSLKRGVLSNALPDSSEFERVVNVLLPYNFPACYIELHAQLENSISKNFLNTDSPIIFSANSWDYDEGFKIFAAHMKKECDAKLIAMQHGGNFGIVKRLFAEDYQKKISDYFITWGWSEIDNNTIVPLPSSKLINHQDIGALSTFKNKSRIVFIVGSPPEFFSDFRYMPSSRGQYIADQILFSNSLNIDIISNITVRLYQSDIKESITNIWTNKNASFENWDVSLVESIKRSRLFICDHLMTTFVEALVMNIPCVLFWRDNYPDGVLRKDSERYFEKLRKAGILYNDPLDAASFVNNIYFNGIDSWWFSEPVQTARSSFCNQYAKKSDDPHAEWSNFLNDINGELT